MALAHGSGKRRNKSSSIKAVPYTCIWLQVVIEYRPRILKYVSFSGVAADRKDLTVLLWLLPCTILIAFCAKRKAFRPVLECLHVTTSNSARVSMWTFQRLHGYTKLESKICTRQSTYSPNLHYMQNTHTWPSIMDCVGQKQSRTSHVCLQITCFL